MRVMSQHKRALFWGLGILAVLALANVAWAEIAAALGHCFSPF
jgi:glycerol-3-phosphate acyltransferase PlsY